MIAAPVQCDVDGIPKGSHYGRVPPWERLATWLVRQQGIVEPVDWSLRAARFRWAELLRRIFEVDVLDGDQANTFLACWVEEIEGWG